MTRDQAAEIKSRQDAVERDLEVYGSLIEQKGWGYLIRTQVGSGMLMDYGSWHAAKARHSLPSGQVAVWPDKVRSFRTGRKGISDNILITNFPWASPHVYFVEEKSGSAVQTPEQKDFEKIVSFMGFTYVLMRSKEDLYEKVWRPPGAMSALMAKHEDYDYSAIPF